MIVVSLFLLLYLMVRLILFGRSVFILDVWYGLFIGMFFVSKLLLEVGGIFGVIWIGMNVEIKGRGCFFMVFFIYLWMRLVFMLCFCVSWEIDMLGFKYVVMSWLCEVGLYWWWLLWLISCIWSLGVFLFMIWCLFILVDILCLRVLCFRRCVEICVYIWYEGDIWCLD